MRERRLTRRALFAAIAALCATPIFAGEKVYRRKDGGSRPANLIRAVQTALADRNFDPGPIDGLMGPRTRSAIRDFQSGAGMEVTGNIDEPLLAALGLR